MTVSLAPASGQSIALGVTPAKLHNEVSGLPRASRGDCEEVNVVQRLAYAFESIVMQVVFQTVGNKLTAQVMAQVAASSS